MPDEYREYRWYTCPVHAGTYVRQYNLDCPTCERTMHEVGPLVAPDPAGIVGLVGRSVGLDTVEGY